MIVPVNYVPLAPSKRGKHRSPNSNEFACITSVLQDIGSGKVYGNVRFRMRHSRPLIQRERLREREVSWDMGDPTSHYST